MKKLVLIVSLSLGLWSCAELQSKVNGEKPFLETLPLAPVEVSWFRQFAEYGVDRFSELRPALGEDLVVLADKRGDVSGYVLSDGAEQWRKSMSVQFTAGPEFGKNKILLGTRNAEVVALSAESGQELWQVRVSSEVLSAPRLAEDMVIVHTADGKVQGISAENGQTIWTFSRQVPVLTLRGTGSPLVVDDTVIIGLPTGKLVALAAADGKMLWESPVALPRGRSELERIVDIDGRIQHADGTLYVTSYQGQVAALTIESGRVLWTREMSSYLGVTIDGRHLYVTDVEGKVWALDKDSGATVWMQDKLAGANTVVTVVGDHLVIGDVDGGLYWMTATDGRLVARYPYLEFATRTGLLNPAEPDDARDGFKRSQGYNDIGVASAPVATANGLLVTYRSGVMANISLKSTM
ncbi:MAG: outer membrane protein assembly factor BamB [Gammaproteobacteria bacterium]|nr:outer membrane protein assembly factor BamB [Gammaproteobacteria bacterium]